MQVHIKVSLHQVPDFPKIPCCTVSHSVVLVSLSPKGQCACVVWSTGRSVTRLTTFKLIWGANPNRDKRLFSSPKHPEWYWSPPSLLFTRHLGLFSGGKVART